MTAQTNTEDTTLINVVKSYIEQLADMNDVVVKNKLDVNMIKLRRTLKQSITLLELIADNKELIEKVVKNPLNDKDVQKLKALSSCIEAISTSVKALKDIGKYSIFLMVMNKMIMKSIDIVLEVNEKLLTITDSANPKVVKDIGESLVTLAKGLLTFVLVTGFGVVPLAATVALLAVELFMTVFNRIFADKNAAENMKQSAETLNEMSKALLLLAISATILALTGKFIKQEWNNVMIMATYLLFVTTVFFLVALIHKYLVTTKSDKALVDIALTLLMISATVVILALTGLFIKQNWNDLLMVVTFLFAAVAMFTILALITRLVKNGEKTMIYIAATLVILSVTILLWALTGQYIVEHWDSILWVTLFVTVATGVMLMLGLVGTKVKDGAMTVLILAVSLAVVSSLIFLFVATGTKLVENWLSVLMTTVFIGIMVGIAIGLGAVKPLALAGATVLAILAGVMIVFALSLMIVVNASKTLTWEGIGLISAFIVGISTATAAAGVMSPLILVGAAALTVLGAAMLLLMPSLLMFVSIIERLQKIDVTEEDIKRPIELMSSLVSTVNKKFGGPRGMLRLTSAAAKMMMMVPIAVSLGVITNILQNIASLSIPTEFDKDGHPTNFVRMTPEDFVTASTNAANIAFILANIFGDEDTTTNIGGQDITIHTVSQEVLKNITLKANWKMLQLSQIAKHIGMMAGVLQNIAFLVLPNEELGFDNNGKPKGYRKMKAADFALAAENASSIAFLLSSIFGDEDRTLEIGGEQITIHAISSEILENITRSTRRKIERLTEITTAIGSMADILQNIASLSIPTGFDKNGKPVAFRSMNASDFTAVTENIKLIVTTLLNAVADESITQILDNLKGRSAKNLTRVMESTNGIVNLVESVGKILNINDSLVTGIQRVRDVVTSYGFVLRDLFIGTHTTYPIIDVEKIDSVKKSLDFVITSTDQVKFVVDNLKKISENTESVDMSNIKTLITTYVSVVYGDENSKSSISEKKVKQFGLYVDDSVKLMKQINKLDTDKLVKYSDMWAKMSDFMDKMKDLNIEELADAIVNRIAPAMEGISDNVDKIGTNTTKPNIAVNPAATVPNTIQPTDATTKLPPERPRDYSDQIERLARLLEEILETRR